MFQLLFDCGSIPVLRLKHKMRRKGRRRPCLTLLERRCQVVARSTRGCSRALVSLTSLLLPSTCLLARSSTALYISVVATAAERKATAPPQKEELMPGTPENGTEVHFVARLFS